MTEVEVMKGEGSSRKRGDESFRSFNSLPAKGRIYILSVFVIGTIVYALQIPLLDNQYLGLSLLLGLLSGIVGSKQVVDPDNKVMFSAETVILGIAYLVGGLPTLLLVSVITTVIQTSLKKRAWYIWAFNLLQIAIQFLILDTCSGWLSHVIPLQSSYNIPALLMGFVFSSIVHTALVATVLYLVNGIPIKKSNTFTALSVIRETCFFCVALSTVMIWEIEPLAILITLAPMYMIYRSIQLPFLKAKSEMDQKTGLLNATTFHETLEKELARAERYNRPLTLVMSDLDYLRQINNTHGHLVGDRVLIETGKTLKKVFREFDIVSRFGGEEFAVILPETSRENVIHVVERARRAVEEMLIPAENADEPIRVTMSFGIAGRDEVIENTTDLIHNADMALYHAKGSGRNCIGVYKDSRVLCVTMPFSIPIEHVVDG
jgi:diguanylate cyclase (GGDEF)-like protein